MVKEEIAVHLDDIGQIAVTVINLDEAKTFYRDVLGMRFLFDAGTMAFFQCGTVRLLLGAGDSKHTPGNGTILYFRVSDIEAVCAAIREKGIAFTEEPHLVARMKSHDLWIAFLSDPSGNPLGLMAELPRTGERETNA